MEKLMSKEEYESRLKAWAQSARNEMSGILSSKTHGSGTLKKIKVSVKEAKKTTSHHAAFKFEPYGVFVQYGVGRGWIRQNGVVIRGSSVKKGSEMEAQLKKRGYTKAEIKKYVSRVKKGSEMEAQLKKRGYSKVEIKKSVIGGGKSEGRKPVDWFDSVLFKHIDELAEIVAEYYGDYSLDKLLDVFNRATIKKNYTKKDIMTNG